MKYLAIDIGNVICDVDFSQFNSALSKSLNISLEDVNYFISRTQKLHDLGLTNISDELRDHFHIKSQIIIDELLSEWNNIITANQIMLLTLTGLLRKGDVKISLLSNIGVEHMAGMERVLTKEIYEGTTHFFSCEVGARKPNHLYYKTFLDLHPEFSGCLYLDDKMENIEAGNKFGFNSRHFALDGFNSEADMINMLLEIQKQYLIDI
jgi:FMN phosphatase YigB (HAD superfamily)